MSFGSFLALFIEKRLYFLILLIDREIFILNIDFLSCSYYNLFEIKRKSALVAQGDSHEKQE